MTLCRNGAVRMAKLESTPHLTHLVRDLPVSSNLCHNNEDFFVRVPRKESFEIRRVLNRETGGSQLGDEVLQVRSGLLLLLPLHHILLLLLLPHLLHVLLLGIRATLALSLRRRWLSLRLPGGRDGHGVGTGGLAKKRCSRWAAGWNTGV